MKIFSTEDISLRQPKFFHKTNFNFLYINIFLQNHRRTSSYHVSVTQTAPRLFKGRPAPLSQAATAPAQLATHFQQMSHNAWKVCDKKYEISVALSLLIFECLAESLYGEDCAEAVQCAHML